MVHYRAHNSPPFASILSHINPVQAPPFYILNICLKIILPYPYTSYKWFLPSDFPIKTIYVFLFSSTRATCPARLVRLDLIARILFGDKHRPRGSSFCHFPQPPVTTPCLHLRSNHLLAILPTNTLSLHPSINLSHHPVHPRTHARTPNRIITFQCLPMFCVFDNKRDSIASLNLVCPQLLRAFQNV